MPARTSENPFRRDFWLGEIDARLPALLRIALGLLVIGDLADRLRDFHAFYTADGIIAGPNAGLLSLRWSLFSLTTSRQATLALFLAGFPLAAALAAGYRSRIACVLVWVFVRSLQNRNLNICDGGDSVLQSLLFWLMFVDAGAAFSLDVRLGRRRGAAAVAAAGFRMLQVQVAYIYLVTFFAKSGPTWRDGSAVYRALVNTDWGRGLAPLVTAHPKLCAALTWATLAIEATFPLLVLSPWRPRLTRAVAIGGGLALHVGIFLTMRIGIFSQVMPASYLVFVDAAWLDRAASWIRERRRRRRSAAAPPPGPTQAAPETAAVDATIPAPPSPALPRQRRWRVWLVLAVAGTQFALIAAEQLLSLAGRRLPRALATQLTLVGHHQNWRMFAPDAPMVDVVWRAPGKLVDGRTVELTATVIPEIGSHGGFLYSRWHRLRNSIMLRMPGLLLPLGHYVCRRHRAAHPDTPLAEFDLIAEVRPTMSAAPPVTQRIFHQSCLAAPPAAAVPVHPR